VSTWPAPAIGTDCTCVRNRSRRFVLMPNELCASCRPKDLRRHQLTVAREKEQQHLNELHNLKATLPGKIEMTKRHIEALNKQLRELGE
jgi:hypothetical protein